MQAPRSQPCPAQTGVYGKAAAGRGVVASGGKAQLRLVPLSAATHPQADSQVTCSRTRTTVCGCATAGRPGSRSRDGRRRDDGAAGAARHVPGMLRLYRMRRIGCDGASEYLVISVWCCREHLERYTASTGGPQLAAEVAHSWLAARSRSTRYSPRTTTTSDLAGRLEESSAPRCWGELLEIVLRSGVRTSGDLGAPAFSIPRRTRSSRLEFD